MRRRRKNNRKAKNYTVMYTLAAIILTVFYATFAQPLAHRLDIIMPGNSSNWWWPWWPWHSDENQDSLPSGDNNSNSNTNTNNKNINKSSYSSSKDAGKEWDVGFINVVKTSSLGDAYEVSSPVYNKLTASFNVAFINPGDAITYTFTIKNLGMIDAKIEAIETSVSNDASDAIKFNVEGIEVGDELDVGQTKDVKVTANYIDNASGNQDTAKKTLNVVIQYVQK